MKEIKELMELAWELGCEVEVTLAVICLVIMAVLIVTAIVYFVKDVNRVAKNKEVVANCKRWKHKLEVIEKW